MIETQTRPFEELAFRAGDEIEVLLVRESGSGRMVVAVLDKRRGRYFEVPVQPGQRARDVFDDPLAYRGSASEMNPDAVRTPYGA